MTETLLSYTGAKRLDNMYFSPMRVVGERAAALSAKGFPVISFASGEPDFDTPETIKNHTIEAIRQNKTHYAPNRGLLSLRQAISEQLERISNVKYDPESEIIVTTGGAEAVNNAFLATLNSGDEVIVFTPAFMNYENMAAMCSATTTPVPLRKENAFQININELRTKITDRTKMIVLNSPCNPTGVIYNEETLAQIARIAVEHNLLVFSDEIYNQITYDGVRCRSIASLPGMRERAITMNGFSKAYAMTGWRLGYIAAERRIASDILKIHQYTTTCIPTFIQAGTAETMNLPETLQEVAKMRGAFEKRRDLFMAGIKEIPGLECVLPQGAFYIFIDVSAAGMDGDMFASRLLEEYYVACIPGSKLGAHCKDFIRVSYATSEENIAEGLRRIKEFVNVNR